MKHNFGKLRNQLQRHYKNRYKDIKLYKYQNSAEPVKYIWQLKKSSSLLKDDTFEDLLENLNNNACNNIY